MTTTTCSTFLSARDDGASGGDDGGDGHRDRALLQGLWRRWSVKWRDGARWTCGNAWSV
jgi:hypothetical protein